MAARAPLGDVLALKIQELRRHDGRSRPLLRIDNRARAAGAPYQFDTVAACLHVKGCRAIPSSSATALYGLWQVPPRARQFACPVCQPAAGEADDVASEGPTDYLYGLLSVLDQFGGVIRERGREFRESDEGQELKAGLDNAYRSLDDWERATLQVVLNSLDGLLATLTDIDRSLDGGPSRNGRHDGSPPGGDHRGAARNGDHGGAARNGDRARAGDG
jgi:hypothetical protein